MALDELDGRILALLEANGRESATKLAAKVGLSRSAVQERVVLRERIARIPEVRSVTTAPVLALHLDRG